MSKPQIAVIGAGLMGHGIAQVFALAGHDVTITDSFSANLDTVKARISANLADLGDDASAVKRVTPNADLAATVRDADYVVEAVLEDLALKQKLFGEIEQHVRPDTILASNTSVIPITQIMQGLKHRERALGTHWWNPPYLVPLVEVIGTHPELRPGLTAQVHIHVERQPEQPAAVAGLVVLSGVHGALLLLLRRDAAPAAWVRHGLRLGFVIWATYWLFQEWFIYVTLLQEPLSLAGVELLLLLAGSLVEGTVIAWLLRSTPGLAAAGGIPIAPERQAADGTAEPRPL